MKFKNLSNSFQNGRAVAEQEIINKANEAGIKFTNDKKIPYKGFNILVKQHSSRFGAIYTATNDTGEDYMDVPGFKTEQEAVSWDKKNIDQYVRENGTGK